MRRFRTSGSFAGNTNTKHAAIPPKRKLRGNPFFCNEWTLQAPARRSDPMHGSPDGLAPLSHPRRRLVARHRGLESPIDVPVGSYVAFVLPIANRKSCQVRRAECSRLEHLGANDRHAEQIG